MIALPPALRNKRWQPGRSSNSSGKGGLYHEMQRLAREFTPQATQFLIDIASDLGEDTRNRIVAMSNSLIAGGASRRSMTRMPSGSSPFDLSRLTPEQRQQVRDALLLIAGTANPVDR